jgi:hypothetical protein
MTIVKFDCRGLELVGFEAREGWMAKGDESGTVFEDIDLTEGEWVDYDAKVSCRPLTSLEHSMDVWYRPALNIVPLFFSFPERVASEHQQH